MRINFNSLECMFLNYCQYYEHFFWCWYLAAHIERIQFKVSFHDINYNKTNFFTLDFSWCPIFLLSIFFDYYPENQKNPFECIHIFHSNKLPNKVFRIVHNSAQTFCFSTKSFDKTVSASSDNHVSSYIYTALSQAVKL